MREAFTYMFKDPGYEKKAIVYFVILFLATALSISPEFANMEMANFSNPKMYAETSNPIFIFFPLIANFFMILLGGYHMVCIQAISKQGNNIVLPFFNFKLAIVTGFKNLIANLLLIIVTLLLFVPFLIILKVASAFVGVLFALFLGIIFNALTWIFAHDGKLTSYLCWKKAISLVKQNSRSYFVNLLVLGLLSLAGTIVIGILSLLFNFLLGNIYLSWIATAAEIAIIASYIAFVCMYLIAKSIKYESIV